MVKILVWEVQCWGVHAFLIYTCENGGNALPYI
jgi:hypothetical protein